MDTRYADPVVWSEGRYIVAFDIHIYNFPKIIITYKYTCRVKLQNGRKSEYIYNYCLQFLKIFQKKKNSSY